MRTIWLKRVKLIPHVLKKLQKAETVLDIGCGIRPQSYINPMVHICCDPHKQYIEYLQSSLTSEIDRSYIFLNADWKTVIEIFPPRSVDTVCLIDIIEHIAKDEALAYLEKTEAIAKRQVVIFTPLGFMPQDHPDGKDGWGLDGGKWQEHKSGWLPEDFDATWDFYACKDFHIIDSTGKKLSKPYGAFWGIKNISNNQDKIECKRINKRKIIFIKNLIIKILKTIKHGLK